MLHTVNKSPTERNTLESCLKHLTKGSAVLLIEDGVYAALKGTTSTKLVEQALKNYPVFALYPDIEARGLQDRIIDGIKLVDYSGFVDLAVEYPRMQAWL
ncbi:MAG: sulfurtransferase complex subunit TusB [Gammaproteobacteria bacterium]|nr:sulfurtransferase complex subunit TusB [Gammaproteobacteria bacterium]MDH5513293.1 sulfurtransferase complex subunit TusB [Gammaproteobacteria bacterium]